MQLGLMPAADTTAADSLRINPINVSAAATGLLGKVEGWFDALVLLLPNLVVALIIVVAAALMARLVRSIVTSVLHRITAHAPSAANVVGLLATLAYLAVLAAGVFAALRVVGLDGIVTTLLAGAGIVGLALGFAFQDIASNFIAGVLMAIRNPFVVGQIIETNSHTGIVTEISLRSTVIETFQGQLVILPNAKVFGDAIINYSATRLRRIDLSIGVGYGDDLEHVERTALRAVESLPDLAAGKPVQLYFTAFGDSSIDFTVRFWVDFAKQTDYLGAQSASIKAIKTAFDAADITIPFPIRTLDFGPSGGVAMREMLGEGAGSREQGAGPF